MFCLCEYNQRLKSFRSRLIESMSREARIIKARDHKWYYFIAHREHGEYPNGDIFGPFSSEDDAHQHMSDNHSNPGGAMIDKSGSEPVPKNVKSPSNMRGGYYR